ncbi:hypothetical protein Bhyg_02214 [Pseudolycoriella hygida]|uniref:G-protein coupled receptors family 1 profile domain-containing protein n=1 Tax=Pseudolycoriella hygida TaxID=35572 RepID=A0A9Q0NCJ0_9DIPT|nr:hypothetical protein Bhyg_02214 [Pseudolycoriella hygida]
MNDPTMMQFSTAESYTNDQVLPDTVIWIYVGVIVLLGFLLNLIMVGILFRSKCNGASIFVIQMIVTDLASLGVAIIELLYMNNRKWIFSPTLCPIYLGLESVTTTASVYFIIAINLHAISTYNLALKTKNNKQKPLMHQHRSSDFQRLNNDSYESALCTQERSLTIDYSKKKDRIAVLCPILFVWILSVSVSIPLFTFSALFPNKGASICGMKNFNRGTNILLQLFVLFIRIIIPSVCLVVTVIYVGHRYLFSKIQSVCRLGRDVNGALKLGLILSITYFIFCTQRVYGSLMFELINRPFMQYKYPVFDQVIAIAFSMVNYAVPAFRPFAYLYADKSLRATLRCRKNSVNPES